MHKSSAGVIAQRSPAPATVTPPGTVVKPATVIRRPSPPLVSLVALALALALVLLVGLAAPGAALAAAKKPAVTKVSPAAGPRAGGTVVTISGRALTSSGRSLVARVKFGTKAATHVRVGSRGRIVCIAPAGKGTVHVVVTTRAGVSARVAAARFTYKAPVAPPVITAFSFQGLHPAVSAAISQTAHTIALTVPCGTDIGALVASFTTSGASVKVGGAVQRSGATANDFSASVTYTATAADASTQTYAVTVTVARDASKAITAFSVAGLDPAVTGIIDQGLHMIVFTVPHGTDVGAIVAVFTTTGESVTVGDVAQISGATGNDFSDDVIYTVTAADASTQDYTVVVTVAPAAAGVSSVSPASGALTAATKMTIVGYGFSGVTGVSVGGAPVADFTVVSDTQITCTGPTYGCTGTVDVIVSTGAGNSDSCGTDQFTFVPTVQSLSVSSAGRSGGGVITITGAGFTGATEVDFGVGNPAGDFTVDSDMQITCTIPAWDQNGPDRPNVTVTVPAGVSDGAFDGDSFTYSSGS